MPRIRLVLEYNGSGFHGWQSQPGVRTLQDEIHRSLEMILGEQISALHASGRTDAGVHAKGQVAHFDIAQLPDLDRLAHALSSVLRNEVSVLDASVVSEEFHARRSAVQKQYSYTILNRRCPAVLDRGRVWFVSAALDREKMKHEAESLLGEHDFTSVRASGCGAPSPVKTILESEIIEDGEYIQYRVVGKGFLKQMVRNIVGTLVGLGKGNLEYHSMSEILAQKDRRAAGVTAPGYGLCLDWVRYQGQGARGSAHDRTNSSS